MGWYTIPRATFAPFVRTGSTSIRGQTTSRGMHSVSLGYSPDLWGPATPQGQAQLTYSQARPCSSPRQGQGRPAAAGSALSTSRWAKPREEAKRHAVVNVATCQQRLHLQCEYYLKSCLARRSRRKSYTTTVLRQERVGNWIIGMGV